MDIPGKSIPTGSSISLGSHGYDPYEVPDMRGIFFARGPSKLIENRILNMIDGFLENIMNTKMEPWQNLL